MGAFTMRLGRTAGEVGPARRWRRRRSEAGGSAVEFALLSVVFLTLLFGMIQYSLYFWSTQSAANAARDGARRAAVGQPCTELQAQAQASTKLVQSSFAVVRRYYRPEDTSFSTPVAAYSGANARIEITYRSVDMNFPFVPMIDDAQVREVAVARVENVSSTSNTNWSSCG
jgi:Flp pilus assembly protein TadG